MFKKTSHNIDQLLSQDWLIKIIQVFDNLFGRLPRLPKIIPNFFVKISPWVALLNGIVGIVAGPVMTLLGLLALVTLQPLIIISYVTSAVIMIFNTFLMFKAFKPLKKRDLRGWIYLFWSNILWLIDSLIDVITGIGEYNLVVLVVSNLIGLYILFEMKRVMVEGGRVEGC